ncbi:preprotein translocase subunit secA [Bordetella ansorpii]|uniref:Protein translocase subunit SecA n=2 Tax=Bordetella ansorpii TaxID=288768 RepID=A0A157S6P8_9BORD|nr:preprotein translocase subunit secA [Bordetella ansorpii]
MRRRPVPLARPPSVPTTTSMVSLLKKLIGSRNDRLLKQYRKLVNQINGLEPKISALSDEELAGKTQEFRSRVQQGTSLDDLLPEAFAVVREAGKRVFGMRHFDVQLLGGIALHNGKIAEMRTGEGKTLMATLPVYLNALSGRGVHVVTVNDYLARRDAESMGRLYGFLGLTTGVVVPQQANEEKIAAYKADITYGTNNEFGFDYLRDNMEYRAEDRRQRGLSYAIVDEVDSILIDEARTPLIISGQAEDHTELYIRMNTVPPLLTRMASEPKPHEPEPEGDYWVDEKSQQVHMSEAGHVHAEEILSRVGLLPPGESLYDPRHIALMHHMMVALRAHTLFFRDQQYVVQDGEVIIVDEFTGRLMVGRRWSDGLHQAVEAKEGVRIQHENQTLASITFQNYFRMYDKLSGMTGTADTEAYEFQEIYSLETMLIPTNRPMIRKDQNDQVFKTAQEKYNAILEDIRDCHQRGQPVLVGTTSIENSELLAGLLNKARLPHEVLNAKQHAREAEIVAEAGKPGHITIATNMAGRGTDIVLGGSVDKQVALIRADESLSEAEREARIAKVRDDWKPLNEQVKAAGGLRIIGTERHESRRIDNQLRGRAGRQGDPGSSRFYLSLEDSLMRIFAGDRVRGIMERLKLPEGEPIEAGMVTRSIETAQRKVEGRNFDIRKQLLEYDDVSNDQRKVLYSQRNEVLEASNIGSTVESLIDGAATELFRSFIPPESVEEQWDVAGLQQALAGDWNLELPLLDMVEKEPNLTDEELLARVIEAARAAYAGKVALVGAESWGQFERSIMLQSIDTHWREHLSSLDYLRQGIHLRGYAQKNPKQEYKREAFELFSGMLDRIRSDVVRVLMTVRVQSPEQVEQAAEAEPSHMQNVQYHHSDYDEALANANADAPAAAAPARNVVPKVGRNDPCPCGSGKKYKQCHGQLT